MCFITNMTNILIVAEDLEVKDHQTLTFTKYFYTTALFRYNGLYFCWSYQNQDCAPCIVFQSNDHLVINVYVCLIAVWQLKTIAKPAMLTFGFPFLLSYWSKLQDNVSTVKLHFLYSGLNSNAMGVRILKKWNNNIIVTLSKATKNVFKYWSHDCSYY